MSSNLDYDGPLIPTTMANDPPGTLLPGGDPPHGP
jgi:hypothetical protein